MTALSLGDSNITHRKPILQLLRMAIDQKWPFSYVTVVKNHVESNPIHLVTLDTEEGVFEVDRKVERTDRNRDEPVMFRAQRGGISLLFKAPVAHDWDQASTEGSTYHYRIKLPYEIRCTQLRQSVRLNVESFPDPIEVTLYLAMGVLMEADLVDISSTGAQFKVEGDASERFANLQVLDACKIVLPDGHAIKVSLQLLGVNYVRSRDVTLLRSQFIDLMSQDEDYLDRFIAAALEDKDSPLIVFSG